MQGIYLLQDQKHITLSDTVVLQEKWLRSKDVYVTYYLTW